MLCSACIVKYANATPGMNQQILDQHQSSPQSCSGYHHPKQQRHDLA